jgi:4-alpha-glucanotransferase
MNFHLESAMPSTSQQEPLFPPGYRASGLLLHITSLPTPYGIGDLGPAALEWIDRLAQAGQSWWQVLPLGPTGYGNSPYSSLSSFAGNWLLISPDALVADGLLLPAEIAHVSYPESHVDYEAVSEFKNGLLQTVWANFNVRAGKHLQRERAQFQHDQADWLDDYALFRAIKKKFHEASYLEWPMELVRRSPEALRWARRELAEQIDQFRLAQFLVFRQGARLREYARSRGIRLIGDLPFFVAPDSCDVWANPELFLIDANHQPFVVAGVPPDYFSEEGQLWGNPIYNWDAHRRTGYRWCIDRMRALLAHVDVIRLDHFRAFAAAWHIPAGAPNAKTGQWVPGPGGEFFRAVWQELGELPFIAEDLGLITPDVDALREQLCVPGTRVLQFAFDGRPDNPYLPHNFVHNTVVYTGTHDNDTTRGWFEDLPEDQRQNVRQYLRQPRLVNDQAAPALLQVAWSSVAALAIAPMQDLLDLGTEARMNVPGLTDGNWLWRATEEMLSGTAFQQLADLTTVCNRTPVRKPMSGSILKQKSIP